MTSIQEATAIILTEAERAELEALARSTKTQYRLRQRARIVLLAAGGMATRAIGREAGCTTGTGLEVAGALRRKAACRPRRDWRAGQRSQIHLRDGQAHPLRSRQPGGYARWTGP